MRRRCPFVVRSDLLARSGSSSVCDARTLATTTGTAAAIARPSRQRSRRFEASDADHPRQLPPPGGHLTGTSLERLTCRHTSRWRRCLPFEFHRSRLANRITIRKPGHCFYREPVIVFSSGVRTPATVPSAQLLEFLRRVNDSF